MYRVNYKNLIHVATKVTPGPLTPTSIMRVRNYKTRQEQGEEVFAGDLTFFNNELKS